MVWERGSSSDCSVAPHVILNFVSRQVYCFRFLSLNQPRKLSPSLLFSITDGSHFQSKAGFLEEHKKRKGFSVRKGHTARRSDGSVQSRSYLCSREGIRQKHSSHVTRKLRALERTNCMARIEYKVDKESVWVVSKVILDHNHHLASASTSHMLKSQRKASNSKTRVGDEVDKAGGEAAGMVGDHGVESVGFVNRHRSSCLSTKRSRDLHKGDAQMLFEFLKGKQLEDPSFFYAIQLDQMDRMTNFFWADMILIFMLDGIT